MSMEPSIRRDQVLMFKTPVSYALITLLLGAAFIAGFLVGFLPMQANQAVLESQNARLQQQKESLDPRVPELERTVQKLRADLKLEQLRGTAGLMSYRANRNNFGAAAELSTGFFNGVKDAIAGAEDPTLRDALAKVLAQRDNVTAALAQANPAVKDQLAEIYANLFESNRAG